MQQYFSSIAAVLQQYCTSIATVLQQYCSSITAVLRIAGSHISGLPQQHSTIKHQDHSSITADYFLSMTSRWCTRGACVQQYQERTAKYSTWCSRIPGTMQYLVQHDNTMQCNTLQCNTNRYKPIQHDTIQCNTIQYNAIQYITIQYNKCNTI